MPSDFSWHGMGPWYHNAFDLLRQILFDESGSVFEKGLSRPIDFCVAQDLPLTLQFRPYRSPLMFADKAEAESGVVSGRN